MLNVQTFDAWSSGAEWREQYSRKSEKRITL